MQLQEKYPENTVILHHMADFYQSMEQKEEAYSCYLKLKELYSIDSSLPLQSGAYEAFEGCPYIFKTGAYEKMAGRI